MKWEIYPNGQLALLADNKTRMRSIGEIREEFKRNDCIVHFRALVVENLHSNIVGGTTFIKDNKIVPDIDKGTICVQYKWTFQETNLLSPPTSTDSHLHRIVSPTVLFPGENYTVPVPYANGTTIAVESPVENHNYSWPPPSFAMLSMAEFQYQTVLKSQFCLEKTPSFSNS